MPFAGFPNFNSCVKAQMKKGKSIESARKICGFLQKKAEGKQKEMKEKTIWENI